MTAAPLLQTRPSRTPARRRRPRVDTPSPAPQLSVADGERLRVVSLAEAASIPFADFAPVRGISSYEGQAHLTGVYWFRGRRVPYRSVLHRDALRVLEFVGEVQQLCLFPFYVHPGPRQPGRAPDFLARLADGRLRVIDVRRAAHAGQRTTQAELAPTRQACQTLRWDYRLITEPDPQVHINLTWLNLYRRRPLDYERYRDDVLAACGPGAAFDELLEAVDLVALALPVVFHMLWTRELRVALEAPICGDSLITAHGGEVRGGR